MIYFVIIYHLAAAYGIYALYTHKVKHITKVAYHDSLTGLPNRLNFKESLNQVLTHAEPNSAVMLLDLDNFKSINDTYGHQAGDDFLIQVASRLRGATRSQDIVCRLHGDEFSVIIHNARSVKEIEIVAARIIDCLREPWIICGQSIIMTASLGVRVVDNYTMTGPDILRDADTAMYYAKQRGKNNYAVWNLSLTDIQNESIKPLLTTSNL